jgi:hypothetical protein
VKKTAFYVTTASVIRLVVLIQLPRLFAYFPILFIVSIQVNETTLGNATEYIYQNYTYYYADYTDFGRSHAYEGVILTHFFIRDVLSVVLILILNTLILFQMKQATNRRLTMSGGHVGLTANRNISVGTQGRIVINHSMTSSVTAAV